MPKHGWKWRTEQIRQLSEDELLNMLHPSRHDDVSPKMARWIYENLAPELSGPIAVTAIDTMGWNGSGVPWVRPFLFRELERRKHTEFGDEIVIALGRHGVCHALDADFYIDLYHDEAAHPVTRGSAVFGINNAAGMAAFWPDPGYGIVPLPPETMARIRTTCAEALADQENAYARAGACWLAHTLGDFEEELERLRHDHTDTGFGSTVAEHAEDW